MSFSDFNLNKSLLRALDDMGFTQPTSIQSKSFSPIMSGRDVLGIAQTGTGKTLAYLLPLMRQWSYSKDRFPQILILVPTRELAVQVKDMLDQLTAYMNVVSVAAYGGVNIKNNQVEVEQGLDVLIATPGRMLDLVFKGSLKLKNVKKLVIDEVDEMLNLGFRSQLTQILDLLPEKRQNLLFSATLSTEVNELSDTFFMDPEMIEAAAAGTPLENISQGLYELPNFYSKIDFLARLLEEQRDMQKVLVFVSTKALADIVHEQLSDQINDTIGIIHSNKDQNFRLNAVRQFDAGQSRVLIATDLIARGLDISDITHVINFDMPEIPEAYIHRIGRTGRLDKQGVAISFVTPKEEEFKALAESLMQYEIPVIPVPEDFIPSERIAEHEEERIIMKNVPVSITVRDETNAAYHEKAAKNQKVNMKIRYKDKMMAKYGKKKTRGAKPRGKKK